MEPLRREPTPAERETLRRRLLARPMPAYDLPAETQAHAALFGAITGIAAVIAAISGYLRPLWILPAAFVGSLFGAMVAAIDGALHRRSWLHAQARLAAGHSGVGPIDEYRLELTGARLLRHPETGAPTLIVQRRDGRLQRLDGPVALALTAEPGFPTQVVDIAWSAEHELVAGIRLSGDPVPVDELAAVLPEPPDPPPTPFATCFDGTLETCVEDWTRYLG